MRADDMFRDIKCVDDVGAMIRLGKFDTEFVAYETAYPDSEGSIQYCVTGNPKKLYDFLQEKRLAGVCFLPPRVYKKRYPVPSGMEDQIAQAVKKEAMSLLKKELQSVDYFGKMASYYNLEGNNAAFPFMEQFQNRIEGRFEELDLQLFEGALLYAWECKTLNENALHQFLNWIEFVRKQMEDTPFVSNQVERTMYGFVYEKDGKYLCGYDAQKDTVIKQYYERRQEGYVVAPILTKRYSFEKFAQFHEIRQQFTAWMKAGECEAYFKFLKKIQSLSGRIPEDIINQFTNDFETAPAARDSLRYYATMWRTGNFE